MTLHRANSKNIFFTVKLALTSATLEVRVSSGVREQTVCEFEEMRFCAPEILDCYVNKRGVRAIPENDFLISAWPILENITELRKWSQLVNYLRKHMGDYPGLVHSLPSLLNKNTMWEWLLGH